MTAHQDWTTAILERAREAGPLPRYGDPTWQSLPPNDPRFVAALVVAAECWRIESDPAVIAERLTLEVAAARQAEQQRQQEAWAETARRIRVSADSPTHDELSRRRVGGS